MFCFVISSHVKEGEQKVWLKGEEDLEMRRRRRRRGHGTQRGEERREEELRERRKERDWARMSVQRVRASYSVCAVRSGVCCWFVCAHIKIGRVFIGECESK